MTYSSPVAFKARFLATVQQPVAQVAEVVETVLSWPATTQLTAQEFGVKLVSKGGD